MESSLPESEGHWAKVSPPESPTPGKWAERAKEAGEDCEIWKISAGDQRRDPQLRFIRESLLATKEEMETWSKSRTRKAKEHQASYSLENGVLKQGTKYGWRIVVPRQKCFDLVRATH
eukprot:5252481-Pleurochrysis_carterae.AAC.1